MFKRIAYILLILLQVPFFSVNACSCPKQAIKSYDQLIPYFQQINNIAEEIRRFLEPQENPQSKTIIFDIDDTLITTNVYLRSSEGLAPIPSMVDLFRWIQQKGFIVIIVTARKVATRKSTLELLNKAGYNISESMVFFVENMCCKEQQRINLAANHNIIATIGDNELDISGQAAGRGFKLPEKPFSGMLSLCRLP